MKISLGKDVKSLIPVYNAPYGIYILKNTTGLPEQFKYGDVVLVSHSWTRNCANRKLILLRDPSIAFSLTLDNEGYYANLLEPQTTEIVITP